MSKHLKGKYTLDYERGGLPVRTERGEQFRRACIKSTKGKVHVFRTHPQEFVQNLIGLTRIPLSRPTYIVTKQSKVKGLVSLTDLVAKRKALANGGNK